MLDLKIEPLTHRLQELEPDKFYFLIVDDLSDDDAQHLSDIIHIAASQIRWSVPSILLLNRPLISMTKNELQGLIDKRGELNGI